jgi:hypothetical protein
MNNEKQNPANEEPVLQAEAVVSDGDADRGDGDSEVRLYGPDSLLDDDVVYSPPLTERQQVIRARLGEVTAARVQRAPINLKRPQG